MRAGKIEQAGPPDEIFDRPETEFVAQFLGDPTMNLFHGEIIRDGSVVVQGKRLLGSDPERSARSVTVGIRPGDLRLVPAEGDIAIDVEVESIEFAGAVSIVHARSGPWRLSALIAERMNPGEHRTFFLARDKVHFFDASTGKRIT